MDKVVQIFNDRRQWQDYPYLDTRIEPETMAFNLCKQNGMTARVIEREGKEIKVIKEFKQQIKRGI